MGGVSSHHSPAEKGRQTARSYLLLPTCQPHILCCQDNGENGSQPSIQPSRDKRMALQRTGWLPKASPEGAEMCPVFVKCRFLFSNLKLFVIPLKIPNHFQPNFRFYLISMKGMCGIPFQYFVFVIHFCNF